MLVTGRRKCPNCGKRFNWYYNSSKKTDENFKPLKGTKEAYAAKNFKVMSQYIYEITVECPDCGEDNVFPHSD